MHNKWHRDEFQTICSRTFLREDSKSKQILGSILHSLTDQSRQVRSGSDPGDDSRFPMKKIRRQHSNAYLNCKKKSFCCFIVLGCCPLWNRSLEQISQKRFLFKRKGPFVRKISFSVPLNTVRLKIFDEIEVNLRSPNCWRMKEQTC